LCCLFFSTFSFGHCVVCSFLLFLLAIVLSVLFYFCFWSLSCLKRIDNTMAKIKSRKEQTTQWPTEKVEKNR
jgi:cytochrome oxidase assembly protein ShyY1